MAPFFHVFRYFGCQRGEGLLVNTDSATMSRPSMLDGGPYDDAPEPGGFEIDFRVLWVILRRNLLLIGSIVAAALVLGLVVTMLMTPRSEEHTSELQSLMRISYAVFCLKKK